MEEIIELNTETEGLDAIKDSNENEDINNYKTLVKKWNLFKFSKSIKRYYDKFSFCKGIKNAENKLLFRTANGSKYSVFFNDDFYNLNFTFYKNKNILLKYKLHKMSDGTHFFHEIDFNFNNIIVIEYIIKYTAKKLRKFIEEEKFRLKQEAEENKRKAEYIEAIDEIVL